MPVVPCACPIGVATGFGGVTIGVQPAGTGGASVTAPGHVAGTAGTIGLFGAAGDKEPLTGSVGLLTGDKEPGHDAVGTTVGVDCFDTS